MTERDQQAEPSPAPPTEPAATEPAAEGFPIRWRRGRRIAAIGVVTIYDYAAIVAGALLAGSRRRRAAWQHRVFSRWCRRVTRILGVRVTVEGPVPRPPYLLVSNHLSWLDIFVLGGVVGGTYVARGDLDGWPIVGAVCRAGDTIWIDRTSKRDLLRVREEVEARMAEGAGVVFFAEGTTGPGDALLPFRASLLEVAAQSGEPVHYATLSYRTDPPAPPAVEAIPWIGDEPFMPSVRRILALSAADATLRFGPEPIADPDRKQLAARLREGMEAIFEPTR